MVDRSKHIVVTVHGIRTFGQWQQRLEMLFKDSPEIAFYHFRFGYFSIAAFVFPLTRWLLVSRFRRELRAVVQRHQPLHLDIVGHSFGTHLIAWALRGLRDDEDIRVRTLILSGSVLRADHYWADLIPSRIGRVVNDCGIEDSVLLLSQFVVPLTGMAGRVGFVGMNGPEFVNRYSTFGHSGYFQDADGKPSDDYMRANWVPLLSSDSPARDFDARTSPNAWRGVVMWISNNFEPIKLLVLTLPLLIFSIVIGALYIKAEATNRRLAAVATLAEGMKYKDTLPDAARPLLDTIQHALFSGFERTAILWVDDNPPNNYAEQAEMEKFGLCFARARTTDEAVRILVANPGVFSVVLSDFARDRDPKAGYGLLDEMQAKKIDVPLIYYVARFTQAQVDDAKRRGARAEVNWTIDLLSEVIDILPPEAKAPSDLELVTQWIRGCSGLWLKPTGSP